MKSYYIGYVKLQGEVLSLGIFKALTTFLLASQTLANKTNMTTRPKLPFQESACQIYQRNRKKRTFFLCK